MIKAEIHLAKRPKLSDKTEPPLMSATDGHAFLIAGRFYRPPHRHGRSLLPPDRSLQNIAILSYCGDWAAGGEDLINEIRDLIFTHFILLMAGRRSHDLNKV